jgi:predicted hydrocarbon binding protein
MPSKYGEYVTQKKHPGPTHESLMKVEPKEDGGLVPKEVMVYYHAAGRRVFQGSIWLRNVPGALADASAALARSGVNLVATSASTIPNADLADWTFFAEAGDGWAGLEKTQEALEACPGVVKSVIKEGKEGMVVDDLRYPLRLSSGEPAMVVSRENLRDMFKRLKAILGSGGKVLVYELGLVYGIKDYAHYSQVLGSKELQRKIPDLLSFYAAYGWGRAMNDENLHSRFSLRPFRGTLRLYDSFECTGTTASTPNGDFLRGHLEGFIQGLTGETIKCEEMKCVSTGDKYCQFECREEPSPLQSQTQWKSEVWRSLNSKSLNEIPR